MKGKITALSADILSGLIVALISIPISMGYAQIAGLPMQYGLYGSVLPILVYALLTCTKDFVFGVDAAPAALVGTTLLSLGIALGSEEAVTTVPVLTLLVALWLLIFRIFRAGRIVKYISTPVMGGFVTGICLTIILMQIPKLMGGAPGSGEAVELLIHIASCIKDIEPVSLALGLATILLIRLGAHFFPRVPMPAILMAAGYCLTVFLHIDTMGVALLPHVDAGFPVPSVPDVLSVNIQDLIFPALMISSVIMSETLLASKSVVLRSGNYMTAEQSDREILAYSLGNLAAAAFGCCPVNGSVSRSALARQYKAASQIMSLVAAAVMVLVLLFLTPYIEYLPVPILTGIVIAALIGACDFHLMRQLRRTCRQEYLIFIAAMLGVLVFGTIYGVVIGVILSFVAVIFKAVVPPKGQMGIIPGREGFYVLDRYRNARPIKETVIYRFGGNLFFANIDKLEQDIYDAVKEDTKQVIIYAVSIGDIDVTAAERLVMLNNNLRSRGIALYITDHVGNINDLLRRYGAGELLYDGTVRRTVRLALRDCDLHEPFPLEDAPDPTLKGDPAPEDTASSDAHDQLTAELEWLFGGDTNSVLEKLSSEVLNEIRGTITSDSHPELIESAEKHTSWGRIGLLDERALLDLIESHIKEEQMEEGSRRAIIRSLSDRRSIIRDKLSSRS